MTKTKYPNTQNTDNLDDAVPEAIYSTEEPLDKAGAEHLLEHLSMDYKEARILTAKKHIRMARFRRTALRLCEGKGYKHLINRETGKPFSTIEELAQEVFGMGRIQMQDMLRAARTEREMYGFHTFIKNRRDEVNTDYLFSEKETPTVYALETLRKTVNTTPERVAQARVDVYFYAKHYAPMWSNRPYPTGEDIKRAGRELGMAARDENDTEREIDKFHLTDVQQYIHTADRLTLQRLQRVINDRLAKL